MPTIGRIVHYVSRGSADGQYGQECRAAVVTAVGDKDVVDLAVLNPTGMFFNQQVRHYEGDKARSRGGTWHWPERAEE